jgi:hypothetical protein
MANTSNLDIISSNLVKDGFCTFRRLFETTRVNLGVVESSNTVHSVATGTGMAQIIVARKQAKFRGYLLRNHIAPATTLQRIRDNLYHRILGPQSSIYDLFNLPLWLQPPNWTKSEANRSRKG